MGCGVFGLGKARVLGFVAGNLARKAVSFCKRYQNGFWLGGFRYVENPVENVENIHFAMYKKVVKRG